MFATASVDSFPSLIGMEARYSWGVHKPAGVCRKSSPVSRRGWTSWRRQTINPKGVSLWHPAAAGGGRGLIYLEVGSACTHRVYIALGGSCSFYTPQVSVREQGLLRDGGAWRGPPGNQAGHLVCLQLGQDPRVGLCSCCPCGFQQGP